MDEINVIWPSWHTVELIGSGSFGKVYKVKREEIGNISYGAVKVMHIPSDESEIRDLQHSGMEFHSIRSYFEDMVKNLMNEIQIMESLKSANNIVGIEDYQVIPKTEGIGWDIYIRMELLTDLGTWLASHEMSVQDVVKLGMDICSALVACEKVHIIHRDIKIDNVFINQFGSFKLGDFGISKQLEKTRSAVSQKGTNMYMAPEVFRGETYNQTVDIYSLGILMYRLLNGGRFPFMPPLGQDLKFDDTQKAMAQRLSGEKIHKPEKADERLGQIIKKACEFEAVNRYQSAGQMLEELRAYFFANAASWTTACKAIEPTGEDSHKNLSVNGTKGSKSAFYSKEGEGTVSAFTSKETNGDDFRNKEKEEDNLLKDNPKKIEEKKKHDKQKPGTNRKTEINSGNQFWSVLVVFILILAFAIGGGVGFYYYQNNKKIEEKKAYNEKMKEAGDVIDSIKELVDTMNYLVQERCLLYTGWHLASLSTQDDDTYSDGLNTMNNSDYVNYIYKPGTEAIYTLSEAIDLFNQDETIKEQRFLVEETKKEIDNAISALQSDADEKTYEVLCTANSIYIEAKQKYTSMINNTSSNSEFQIDDFTKELENYNITCKNIKEKLEAAKAELPQIK